MASGFLPPVLFTIQANATQAMATFGKVNAQLKAMEAQAAKTGAAVTGMSKAFVIASAAAKGLGLILAGFAVYGLKEVTQLEDAYTRLGVSLANVGLSSDENRKKVADLAQSYETLGFDAANAADGFGILIAAGNDVEKSTKLMALAADYARVKQVPLESAARILARAQNGSARAFKEFGITLDKTKPKAEAAAEAMGKLEAKIGGQAQAYTKTFRGQLAVLGKQIENVAEAIGVVLIPVLSKLIKGITSVIKWLTKHSEVLVAIAAVITGVLILAVVKLTQKLYAQAIAWAVANWQITLIVAAIGALVAAFVWAWNKFSWFRKGIVDGLKLMLKWWGFLLRAIGVVAEGLLQIITGPLRLLLKGLGYFNDDARKMSEELDKLPARVGNFFDNAATKIEGYAKTVEKLKDKKIDFSGFKLPGLDIPKFKNSANAATAAGQDAANKTKDAWIKAMQRIIDFNTKVKDTMKEIKAVFKSVVSRDYMAEIADNLANPIDQLVKKAQTAVTAYQNASNKFADAQGKLQKAQVAYANAVKSGNKQAIATTESNLKRAEDAVTALQDTMKKNMESIKGFQDEMISGVVDATNEIKELQNQRKQAIIDSDKEEAEARKEYLTERYNLENEYAKNVTSLQREAAKRTVDTIKSSVDSMRNVFKNATQKSIGDMYSALTYEGKYLKGGSTEKILGALLKQTSKAETLAGDAAKLSSLGFTQTFIEEVMAQGPDVGHGLAQTIINSSPESIKQMQEYWNKLQQTTNHGVDNVAVEINNRLGLATEEMRANLIEISTELNSQLKELADTLQTQLAAAYNKYDEALKAIRDKNKQTVKEIDDQITALQTKIKQLETAMANMANLQAPGSKQTPVDLAKPIVQQPTYVPPVTAGQGIPVAGVAQTMGGNMTSPTKQIVVGGNTITVSAQTNASPQQIAQDVGWAIRTSADVQYYMVGGRKITVPAGKGF